MTGCGLKVDAVKEEAMGRCFSCICFRATSVVVVVVEGKGRYELNDLLLDDFKATDRSGVDVMENPIAMLLASRMSVATSNAVEAGKYNIVRDIMSKAKIWSWRDSVGRRPRTYHL
jgi:hypothetical protein